jgi:hypothetical protein
MTHAPLKYFRRVGRKNPAPVKAVPTPTPKEVDECLNPLRSMPSLLDYQRCPHPCTPQDNRDFARHLNHFMGQLHRIGVNENNTIRDALMADIRTKIRTDHGTPIRRWLNLSILIDLTGYI